MSFRNLVLVLLFGCYEGVVLGAPQSPLPTTTPSVASKSQVAADEPATPVSPSDLYDRAADPHAFQTFMTNSGWCWFQDPRVIANRDKLFIGAVAGNGSGAAWVGVYDLTKQQPIGSVMMHDKFNRDDHNSPVFHVRPDGSLLATYARHHGNEFHYSRVSDSADPLSWSDERKHLRTSPNPKDRVTYMNFCDLKSEGKLYNFYRGVNFNPTFATSTDQGDTWSDPVHFFKNEGESRRRPYARYTTNGTDTIYVSITDGHPRLYGNNLYYFEFRDGNFYKSDGTLIKNLATDGPLLPSEAECVYQGSGISRNGQGKSAPNSAWTSSIAVDKQGHAHIGYSVYISNDDHRYRIASWDGSRWHDREVAFAGNCLYKNESSYTGLITLDPDDPTTVFVSTDVAPSTGEALGGLGQHEIFRAYVGIQDDVVSTQWVPVTRNSPVRNIRPIVVRDGDTRIVLWNRGEFRTFADYELDTVGFVENASEHRPVAEEVQLELTRNMPPS